MGRQDGMTGDRGEGSMVGSGTRDGIAELTISNPPVNALSRAVSAALISAIQGAARDDAVHAILIRASGRTWPAGADIREFGDARGLSLTPALTAAVRSCPKPVVALLHGTVLGGGLELALAASARLAMPGTVFGLPEGTLGLLPGAGGTQDLPRLIGPAAALNMMLTGRSLGTDAALASGLIDGLLDDDAPEVARAFALSLTAGQGGARRPDHAGDPQRWIAAVAAARAARPPMPGPARDRIIDCVEAALLLPEPAGRVFERTAFDDLLATPESAGLRHAFLSEKRAVRSPLLGGAVPPRIARLAIAGHGSEVAQAAHAAIAGGIPTVIAAPDEAVLTRVLSDIAEVQEARKARGDLSAEALDREWALLTGSVGGAAVAGADLILRTDPEGPLTLGGATAILGSEAPGHGAAGLILTHGTRLGEVIAGPGVAPAALASLTGFVRQIGRVPVLSRRRIMPVMLAALARAADHLVAAGASPGAVDRALEGGGMAAGPFALRDAGGPLAAMLAPAQGSLVALVMGELGGQGMLSPGVGTLPEALALIAAGREAAGIAPRRVAEAEIIARCQTATANAGARLVMQDAGLRPSDIDVAMMLGAGLPRWSGGPMHAADHAGLLPTRRELRGFAADDPGLWNPVALWDELIREGRRFADLNGD
jgi:3-hydroxyacyl-CoA dehydrogenase